MITSMHIENFKCFKSFDIDLGPFNVLIGPNDSGKTAFMHAVALSAGSPPEGHWHLETYAGRMGLTVGIDNLWRKETGSPMVLQVRATQEWGKRQPDWPCLEIQSSNGHSMVSSMRGSEDAPPDWERMAPEGRDWQQEWLSAAVGRAGYYEFDPGALRVPTALDTAMDWRGRGFPTFLDDLLRDDRDAFVAMEKEFYRRFPFYKRVTLEKERTSLGLQFKTAQGYKLPAKAISDGVVLSLAFLAVCHSPSAPSILLIEEPENGVHHAALKDIVATLRGLSEKKHVQVVIATHSPYLLDQVEPEEVRVFWKDKEGAVHAANMADAPALEDMKKHFMTGEIWSCLSEAGLVGEMRGEK